MTQTSLRKITQALFDSIWLTHTHGEIWFLSIVFEYALEYFFTEKSIILGFFQDLSNFES